MLKVSGWQVPIVAALLAGGGAFIALSASRAALGATAGKVILKGARPFTESWSQIVRRDASARQAARREKPDSAPPEDESRQERDEEGGLKPLAGLLRSAQD